MAITFPERRTVYLRNFNVRMEKHGEDDVPAGDLAVEITGPNTLLDMIHPQLRPTLFKPLQAKDDQLALSNGDMPSVRFPGMKMPISFDQEQAGMTLHVHYGASGKADMVLGDVKLSKVQVEQAIEGSSCVIRCNLSSTNIDEKVVGKLSLLQKHDIEITLKPAEVATSAMEDKKAQAKAEADALFKTPPKTPEQALADTAKA